MTPEIHHRAASPIQLERQEALFRVQRNAISVDLRKIQSDLRLDLLQAQRDRGEPIDSKTVLILEWHQRFSRVLKECEHPQPVFDEFKGLLQQILVDSVFKSALDENCLLGSDGETYTEMGLQIYRAMAPTSFQNRSPFHPEEASPLETSPHVCARYMVAWLNRHNVDHRNAQNAALEEAYRQLSLTAHRPPPSEMSQDEAMRLIMARQAQRQMQRDQERNQRIQARRIQMAEQAEADLTPIVRREFAAVEERVAQVAQRQMAQAQALNQDICREIHALQPVIDLLEVEIAELTQRERAIEEQNHRVFDGIAALHRIHQQLALESTQLQIQIKANEKSGWKVLGQALATIGFCALGTFVIHCALTAAAAATGAAGSAASSTVVAKSGGALLKVSIQF